MNGVTRAQHALFPARSRWKEVAQATGNGVRFERIRCITGYLVGTLDRFNDAKRAEECERVKHQA